MNFKSATTWRRVLLAVLVVGALAWFAGWGLPQVCSQQLPTDSVQPVDVCKALPATDPRALLFLLIVGALLLPDLAELEVGGVLKVRRQLDVVQGEASELKNELAHVRTQVMTAAAAAANSQSKATATVNMGRTGEVADAFKQGGGPDDGDFDNSASEGVYAVAAYDAGFYGLLQYLPEEMKPAMVAGYTFNDDGELELYSLVSHGNVPNELGQAQDADRAPDATGTYVRDSPEAGWVLSVPALDDEGGVVGALTVRVGHENLPSALEDMEAAVSQIEVMAGSYARLLIDILGEKPRPQLAGKTTGEGTQ